jgi:hypothetical protein
VHFNRICFSSHFQRGIIIFFAIIINKNSPILFRQWVLRKSSGWKYVQFKRKVGHDKEVWGTEVYLHEFLTSALGGGAFSGLIVAALNPAEQSPSDWQQCRYRLDDVHSSRCHRRERNQVTQSADAYSSDWTIPPNGFCLFLPSLLCSHLDLGRFFSFLILYTTGSTPWTGDQPVARPLPTQENTNTE